MHQENPVKDPQTIISEYLTGDLDCDEAIDELIKTGLTAMEAERIIEDLE